MVIVAALMWTAAPASAADPVIAAAGDIACDPAHPFFNGGAGTSTYCHQQYTSDLLVDAQGLPTVDAVLPVGDIQYECASPSAFAQSYDPTWGRPALKALTFPAAGNHDYNTSGGTDCDATGQGLGYFGYFGAAAGDPTKGYYSYDIGAWHLIALNTNINCAAIACGPGSAQEQWLKADLAAHPAACTLAYFHHSLFSSKTPVGAPRAFWQDLHDAGADVVLSAHVHHYERFAPQTPAGVADPATGIRQFVVGMGGRNLEASLQVGGGPAANSEVRAKAFGVLKLTLHPTGYDWQFVPDAPPNPPFLPTTFTDSGSGGCHDAPGAPDTIAPTVSVTTPAAGTTVSGTRTISANAVDAGGVNHVDFLLGGKTVATDATAPYSVSWNSTTVADGSRTISARAVDNAGNQSTASVSVRVSNVHSDIYRVRVDGTRLRRVTRAPAKVGYDSPAWSRSGRRIAFSGPSCAGCPGAIFLIQPGGAGQRRLPGTVPGAARPSWGPLDRSLTFVGGPTSAVYTISSRGTGQRRLTGDPIAHDQSAWSPDGRQIAYTTQQPNGGWDILVMRTDGSRKRNLTRTSASEVQPAWSHDGQRIAFTRQVGAKSAIFVMTVGAGRARRVTFLAGNCQQPAWSPDDRQVACARFTAKGSSIIILIIGPNGIHQSRLPTGTATAWAPTWSPDGQRIAFTSTR